MGCKCSKVTPVHETAVRRVNYNRRPTLSRIDELESDDDSGTIDEAIISQKNMLADDAIIGTLATAKDHVEIQVADSQAFNSSFIAQRQQAIDNPSYRSTIESWRPKSLQQLVDAIKALSTGKSLVDRHWIIFYWITINIEYDTVSYFSKNYQDQSAEGVFRTKKGVCAGYGNLYKYLCDQLSIPCEKVSGYAKGYGFDDREGIPTDTDHAWNVVEIDQHWYLIESTWGAGHLNEQKAFVRELTTYYFLPRPNEMIYHHLPEDDRWQLLREPIKKTQYMQMPKLRSSFFEFNLELVSPRHQAYATLLPGKPYALILLRAPPDVYLIADLKLQDKKIEGGHQVVFDARNRFYRCYFAPTSVGKHKITIYGKRGGTDEGSHTSALEFPLDIKQIPKPIVSFPNTWKKFFDLGLKIISPRNTHLIRIENGANHAQIRIQTSNDVELLGRLTNSDNEQIVGGNRIYYDRHKGFWRCKFAPDRDGIFEALIMAKKKSDPGLYTSAVSFKLEAKRLPAPPLSYPKTWQLFHDLNLKVEAPRDRATAVWPENASYAEIRIRASDDVQLSCNINYNNANVENGTLAQFDSEKQQWQLLFAPQRTGPHELIIFARRQTDAGSSSSSAVMFPLNVTQLRRPMTFPTIYTQFQTSKCRIYEPMNGTLKKGSSVPIHCMIPGATDVNVQVDSKWLKAEGYEDPVLRRQITVGSQDVAIYAKYDQKESYDGLVKYSVQ